MKNNGRFITLIVILLLVSAAVLTGCMETLATSMPEEKTFDPNDVVDVETLMQGSDFAAQSEMREKFAKYAKVETESYGTVLTLFPDGQADELIERRKNGEEFHLSYEEILFIINDSVQLYNKYDIIFLPRANMLGLTPIALSGWTDWDIKTNHADTSEMSYEESVRMMAMKSANIYTIILYRLYLLDTGLLCYYERESNNPADYTGEINYTGFVDYIRSFSIGSAGFAIVLDETGSSFSGIMDEENDHYSDFLRNCLIESRLLQYERFMDRIVALPKGCMLIDFSNFHINLYIGGTHTLLDPLDNGEMDERVFETDEITISLGTYIDDTISQTKTIKSADVKRLLEALDPKSVVQNYTWADPVMNGEWFYYVVDFGNGTKILIPVDGDDGTAIIINQWTVIRGKVITRCVPKEFTSLVKELYRPTYPEKLMQSLSSVEPQMYENYVNAINNLAGSMNRNGGLSCKYNKGGIMLLPEYKELEELILSDQRYAYLVLRDWVDTPNGTSTYGADAYIMCSEVLLSNSANLRNLNAVSNVYTVVETALSDPEKYLPY